jgi:hypothetical protein
LASPIVEPRLAKSVAAATSASGAVITNDMWHLLVCHD